MGREGAGVAADALRRYRLRAVDIAVQATAMVLVVMTVFGLLPKGQADVDPAYWLVVVAAAVGALGLHLVVPWDRLLRGSAGMVVMTLWSSFDIVLVCLAVRWTGGPASVLWSVFALTTVFFAAGYPRKHQVVLLVATNAGYLATLLADAASFRLPIVLVRLAVIDVVAFMASFMSNELNREMEQATRRETSFRGLFQANPQPMWVSDRATGQLLEVNDAAVAHYGWERETFLALRVAHVEIEPGRHRCADEREIDVEVRTHDVDLAGRPVTLTLITDVTEQRRLELAQQHAERRLEAIVAHASDIICVLGPDGTTRYANPAVATVLGSLDGFRPGESAISRVHPDDAPLVGAAFNGLVRSGGAADRVECRASHADGTWRLLELIASNQLGRPGIDGIVITARDVTERRAMESQLAHQALHDHLTGLPNRALLLDRLSHALERAGRRGSKVGVLFVDLDHFKLVNDSMGHAAGDQLLVAVAARFQDAMRPGDTVARLGGDEFVLLCEDVDVDGVRLVADRVQSSLEAPFVLEDRDVFVTASIGIASGSAEAGSETLLSQADAAMYRAKERGRRRTELFDEQLRSRAVARLEVEADLRAALAGDELEVWFQPKVSLATGEVVGAEALVRWQHPTRGLVMPGAFVDVAEDTGLIGPLGERVLQLACREASAWPAALPVAVNVSARQLADPRLVDVVAAALADAALPGDRLLLELTESALMDDPDAALSLLRELKQLGVRVAIDDFGTGYSSLSYLRRFPIDELKVDRSFVAELTSRGESAAIVEAVIAMARSLGVVSLAEGIETPEQVARLRELGCELGQGYLFGRPAPAAAAVAMFTGDTGAVGVVA